MTAAALRRRRPGMLATRHLKDTILDLRGLRAYSRRSV
jgi:hypothetical protein